MIISIHTGWARPLREALWLYETHSPHVVWFDYNANIHTLRTLSSATSSCHSCFRVTQASVDGFANKHNSSVILGMMSKGGVTTLWAGLVSLLFSILFSTCSIPWVCSLGSRVRGERTVHTQLSFHHELLTQGRLDSCGVVSSTWTPARWCWFTCCALSPWDSHLTSLNLDFLILKRGIIGALIFHSYHEELISKYMYKVQNGICSRVSNKREC